MLIQADSATLDTLIWLSLLELNAAIQDKLLSQNSMIYWLLLSQH